MCLRLPLFEELSSEQRHAFRLVGDKTVLVTGPPGTGKSVIALFRAANVQQLGNDRNPVLLTAGKLLQLWTKKALVEACEALDADPDRVTVKTVEAWFGGHPNNPAAGWFYKTFGEAAPRYEPKPRSTFRAINWDAAYDIAAAAVSAQPTIDLIVDEAQDLHQNFWQIVLPYCRSCTIFCDTNQTLRDDAGEHFSDRDFAAILGIEEADAEHWAKLSINYRNSGNIASAVNAVCPPLGDEKRSIPDSTLPGSKPVVQGFDSFNDCIDYIATVAVNYPQASHGLLVASRADLNKAMGRLKRIAAKGSFSDLQFQEYVPGPKGAGVDPCQPGILATYGNNVKGLEFDFVYVVALQHWQYPFDTAHRNRMYVCMTRARTNLEVMFDGEGDPPVLSELPSEYFERK